MEEIKFPKNVEVGKFYIVPCVWQQKGMRYASQKMGRYIPVNSHLHEDKKVIGADFLHWHIDWRFVETRLWKQRIEGGYENGFYDPAYKATEGKLEVANVIIYHKDAYRHYSNGTDDKMIYYRRLKCKRPYMVKTFFENDIFRQPAKSWVFSLSEKFCNSQLKKDGDRLICPHKGIAIDKNCKDKDGNYICPGHLLRFNPDTLQVIPNRIIKEVNTL